MDSSTLKLLADLNTLYSNAFTHLIYVGLFVFGMVGVIVPAVITVLQNRSQRKELDALNNQLKQYAAEVIADKGKEIGGELKEDYETHLRDALKDLASKIEELERSQSQKMAVLDGKIYHVEGMYLLGNNKHALAVDSLLSACSRYLLGGDFMGLQRLLETIGKQLGKLSIEDLEDGLDDRISNLCKKLGETNTNRIWTDHIHKLERAVKKVQHRNAATESSTRSEREKDSAQKPA